MSFHQKITKMSQTIKTLNATITQLFKELFEFIRVYYAIPIILVLSETKLSDFIEKCFFLLYFIILEIFQSLHTLNTAFNSSPTK